MYNEYDKMCYIEAKQREVTINVFQLPNLFRRSEPFENELGKDVSKFTKEEVVAMLTQIGYKSLNAIKVETSYWHDYTRWSGTPDTQNGFILSLDELNSMLPKKRIVTRTEVLDWCGKVLNPSDCVILLGIFEGIKGEDYCELVSLKRSDIDVGQSTVKLYGRSEPLKVSTTLIDYMLESADTNIYYPYGDVVEKKYMIIASSLVIKESSNTKEDASVFRKGRRIYTKARIVFDYLGVGDWMKPNILTTSGIIDTILTGSNKNGMKCQDYLLTRECRAEIKYRYKKDIQPRQFILEYGTYLG